MHGYPLQNLSVLQGREGSVSIQFEFFVQGRPPLLLPRLYDEAFVRLAEAQPRKSEATEKKAGLEILTGRGRRKESGISPTLKSAERTKGNMRGSVVHPGRKPIRSV